jgi:hypothetical protein
MTPTGYVRDVVERVTSSVLAARAAGHVEPEEILAEHIRHTSTCCWTAPRCPPRRSSPTRPVVVRASAPAWPTAVRGSLRLRPRSGGPCRVLPPRP